MKAGCECIWVHLCEGGVGWDLGVVGISQGVNVSGGIYVGVGCVGGRNREAKEQQA